MKKDIIIPEDAYKRYYKIRATGREGLSFETTIPREVIVKEAEKQDMSLDDFVDNFVALWRYNDFRGMHFEFVKALKR